MPRREYGFISTRTDAIAIHDSKNPEDWVEAHGEYLYRFAMTRLRNRPKAEDVVQETFLAGIRGINSYTGSSTIRTWLVGILKHKILDCYREVKRHPTRDMDSIDDLYDSRNHLDPPAQSWKGTPSDICEKEEFWVQMLICVSRLPKRQATLFTMREIDGFGRDDICKVLEITPTNYWVLLHRCRVALRKCLNVHWFGGDEKDDKRC